MQPNDYSFITNPDKPEQKRSFALSGSPVLRAAVVAFGLFVLIIIFVVIKGILNSGSVVPSYLGLVQDQQSMVHLVTNATQETSLSSTNKAFALTAQLSLTSDQSNTLQYLATTGTKIGTKKLNLKVSPLLDKQLVDAAAASNYDRVFEEIMQTKLTNYEQALKNAYDKTKGPKGRDMLSKQYTGAELLVRQLKANATP